MATVAEMQAQIDSLRDLRAKGISRASIQSPVSRREIEYRSDAEIVSAIADLERRIAAETMPRQRIINPKVSKGY